MCGICGILYPGHGQLGARLRRMNDAQSHRGPDGEGYFIDAKTRSAQYDRPLSADAAGSFGLAHRRLAIIDPEKGRQPMVSNGTRCVVALNGEIYNFQALRDELTTDYHFVTDSDTEVLLALYEKYPDRPAEWIARLNGMFAFAIWDVRRRRLLLARDPFGVKPLHYARLGQSFLFASEAKSLLAAGVPARLNLAALHVFMNVRYVPGCDTLFSGISRFPPAHYAWVQDGILRTPQRFYEQPGPGQRFSGDRRELCDAVRHTYYKAVRSQLISDVPLGVSLSGGLDSSMNVAAAHDALSNNTDIRVADRKLRTFTIGFNEPTDELSAAAIIAEKFDTQHTAAVLELNPLGRMDEVIRAVEEPKINIIQGYMLAEMAREHVKVLLGGLGGDELFAGYDIHRFCNTLGRAHGWMPGWLHRVLLRPLGSAWWRLQNLSGMLKFEHYRIGGQIALSLGDRAQFYARLRNAWDYDKGMYSRVYADPAKFMALPRTGSYFDPFFGHQDDYLDEVLRTEFQTKMVNDFLLNEDRVMSSHGVEGRVPFLDRDLVELAMSVPSKEKMLGTGTKWLWRESVCNVLPSEITNRKKQGFTFSSYHQWTKDLRARVKHEISPAWCAESGLFNPRFVKDLLEYPPHSNLRWHYFMAWMMLGVKHWLEVFDVEIC